MRRGTLASYLKTQGISEPRPPSPEPVKTTRFNKYRNKYAFERSMSPTPAITSFDEYAQRKLTTELSPPPPPVKRSMRKQKTKNNPDRDVSDNGVFSEDEDDTSPPTSSSATNPSLPATHAIKNPPSPQKSVFSDGEDDTPVSDAARTKKMRKTNFSTKPSSEPTDTKVRNLLGKYISESTFVTASVPLCVIWFTWFIASNYKSVYNFQTEFLKTVVGGIDVATVGKNLENVRPFFEGCFGIFVASGVYVGFGTEIVDKAIELSARYNILQETKIVMSLLLFVWVVSEMLGLSFLWALTTLLGTPFLNFFGSGFLTYADYYFRLYSKGIPLASVCTNTDKQFDTIFTPQLQDLTHEFLNNPPNVSQTEADIFRTLIRFMQQLSATRNPFSAFSRALFHTGAEETIDTVANATILNEYFNTTLFTDCNPKMAAWANASNASVTIPACAGNSQAYQATVPHAQEMCMIGGAFGGEVSVAGITQQLLLMGGAVAMFTYGTKLVFNLFKWTYELFTRLATQVLRHSNNKIPPFIRKCFGLVSTMLLLWYKTYIVDNVFAIKEGLVAQLSGYFSDDGVLGTLLGAAQHVLADTGFYLAGTLTNILPGSEIVTTTATLNDTMYAAGILMCFTAFSKLVYHFLRTMATTTKSYSNKTSTRMHNVTSARLVKRFKVAPTSCVRAPLLASL